MPEGAQRPCQSWKRSNLGTGMHGGNFQHLSFEHKSTQPCSLSCTPAGPRHAPIRPSWRRRRCSAGGSSWRGLGARLPGRWSCSNTKAAMEGENHIKITVMVIAFASNVLLRSFPQCESPFLKKKICGTSIYSVPVLEHNEGSSVNTAIRRQVAAA